MPAIPSDHVFGSHILEPGPMPHSRVTSNHSNIFAGDLLETLTNNVSHITISIRAISYGNSP